MNRRKRKMLALVICFLLLAHSSGLWVITAAADSAPAPVELISLYDVRAVSQRSRPMETTYRAGTLSWTWALMGTVMNHGSLCYDYIWLDDIPLLEVYKADGAQKPLLLLLPGLGHSKESLLPLLLAYAEAGYYAVAIDAFDQGERHNSAVVCDNWAAMLITVADIDQVLTYYKGISRADAENFVLGGFSIGAIASWAYVELGSYTPTALLTFSGVCDYDAWWPNVREKLPYLWLKPWMRSVWAFPEVQNETYTRRKYESIRALDISAHISEFENIPVFCTIGTEDKFFSCRNVKAVADQLVNSGNPYVDCIVYDGAAHEITEEMLTDSLEFLRQLHDFEKENGK